MAPTSDRENDRTESSKTTTASNTSNGTRSEDHRTEILQTTMAACNISGGANREHHRTDIFQTTLATRNSADGPIEAIRNEPPAATTEMIPTLVERLNSNEEDLVEVPPPAQPPVDGIDVPPPVDGIDVPPPIDGIDVPPPVDGIDEVLSCTTETTDQADLIETREPFSRSLESITSPTFTHITTPSQDDISDEETNEYCTGLKGSSAIFIFRTFLKGSEARCREGSERDRERCLELCRELDLDVKNYDDLTKPKMKKKIKKIKNKSYSLFSSLFIFVSSYGNLGTFLCSDGEEFIIEDLLKALAENVTLIRKPKVILMESCQIINSVTNIGINTYYDNMVKKYPDTALVLATSPGCKAFRNCQSGSHFINVLCDVITDYRLKLDFEQMVYEVIRRFGNMRLGPEGKTQKPVIFSSLKKFVRLRHL